MFESISNQDLLKQYSLTIEELKKRKVVRSRNNPVADYAEQYVSNKLKLKLANGCNKGHDAIGHDKKKYQIKGRLFYEKNDSRQLGVIRNLDKKDFDFLIAVLFDWEFNAFEVWKIPHEIIKDYARFSLHQNGYILTLKGSVLKDKKAFRLKALEEQSIFERPIVNKLKSEEKIVNFQIKQGMV